MSVATRKDLQSALAEGRVALLVKPWGRVHKLLCAGRWGCNFTKIHICVDEETLIISNSGQLTQIRKGLESAQSPQKSKML